MKKLYRIRKNEEFKEILDLRHRLQDDCFKIAYSKKANEQARFGISVSKRNGNAVLRNKIKRQIRMMINELVDFNNYEYDVIIIIKRDYLRKNYEYNRNNLEILLKKCKIK